MNIQTLRLLAKVAKKIPPERFHMGVAFRLEGDKKTKKPQLEADFCGWSTVAAIDKLPIRYQTKEIKFYDYSMDFFDLSDNEWQFLFSALWINYDNTVEGAFKRTCFLGSGKELPKYWIDEIKKGNIFY